MAYSARNWGFTPHNTSILSSLNNMILSYSHQIDALQQNAYNGYASQDIMARVLSLSKARAQKLYQEDKLKNFMAKFISGEAVTFEEVASFLTALILENPYLDDRSPKPAGVEIKEFTNDNRGQYNPDTKKVEINRLYIDELVNLTASVDERFKLLYRIIMTTGHENTHFLQNNLNDEYIYNDSFNYLAFATPDKPRGWEFLKKIANISDICDEDLLQLSSYIYFNSPHEIDARLGGIAFANHVMRELAARFNHDKDFNNFEENYSAYIAIEKLREELRVNNIIDETSSQFDWDGDSLASAWLGKILGSIDVEKFAKIGLDLQELIISSKNRDLNDYNQFNNQLSTTYYNYYSLLQFVCMASNDDGNFSTKLLRQFIKDGNISSEILLNNMLNIQKRDALEISFDINLSQLLTGDEVNIASFQRSDCLRFGKPLLGLTQRINILIELINQDKFQYLEYILPSQQTLTSDKYIQEALHNKVIEYTQRLQKNDITLYPQHFYILRRMTQLCQMQDDEAYLNQYLPAVELLTLNMHPQQARLNHSKIYGKEASDFYYDKFLQEYPLSQEEARALCNEVFELTQG